MDKNKLGMRIGAIAVALNLMLAAAKLTAGTLSGSISITSDAANNFFDSVSAVAVALTFKISAKKADKEHPFGHGRTEYITSFIIAVLIILTGGEFFISSVKNIITPSEIVFSWVYFGIITGSILVKLGMAFMYSAANKKLGAMTLKAAKIDSIQDMAVTSVALAALIASRYTAFPVDGIAGIIISAVILLSGLKMVKETIDAIMGKNNNGELSAKITAEVTGEELVLGAHDLLLHDYGAGHSIASIHAELPDNLSLNAAHRIIDGIEKKVMHTCGVDLVVHIDPTDTDSKEVQILRKKLKKLLEEISPELTYHDFDINFEDKIINVDIAIPYESKLEESLVAQKLSFSELDGYVINCKFDYK